MLYTKLATMAFLLSSAASASHLHERHPEVLIERGGYGGGSPARGESYKFAPTTQTATGDTCDAAFGGGYKTCREQGDGQNRLCYNPAAGQQCCSSSWSCPNGSFCLAGGTCCPNGMDPADCGALASSTSSSAAPLSTSSAAPTTSSYPMHLAKTHNTTSSIRKTYPTTLANVTSVVMSTGAATAAPTTATPSDSPAIGSASHASLSGAGLLGAGILALLATF